MKHLFFLLLAGFLLISAKNPDAEGIEFFQGSFTSAKLKAAEEGKLFFLDFTASWCTPCRWMEETTFTDPTLAAYVKENYVALQVDIDDFDGYALKQEYNISILPSLLIFNSEGILLAQYEQSLSPSNMLEILKKYDSPDNRKITRSAVSNFQNNNTLASENSFATNFENTATTSVNDMKLPATIMVNTPSTSPAETVDYTSNRPPAVGNISRRPLMKKDKQLVSFPEEKVQETQETQNNEQPYYLHHTPTTTTYNYTDESNTVVEAPIKTEEKPISHLPTLDPYTDSGEGLYRFQVARQTSSGYSVQVGAYAEYGNVLKQSSMLQAHFDAPVIVHISKNRNRNLYKLMLGEFETRSAAIEFMKTVQAKGVECMIKNLSIY